MTTSRVDPDNDIIAQLKAEAAEDDGDGDENELRRECKQFAREVADAKEFFGMWDMCDPVARALLRAVAAQNDVAHAYDMYAQGTGDDAYSKRPSKRASRPFTPCTRRSNDGRVVLIRL